MYQLVKRLYIYGILIVYVIESSPYLCYVQRILSDSILNKCYAVSYVHIVQLAIGTILSQTEMYHDTFTNQKKYNFLCSGLIKKSDREIKQAYILFVKFMHPVLALHVNLIVM